MHYYAIINEEYIVLEVISSDTVIDDPTYIEITEEQYNDEGFLGSFYDQDKDEFVGVVMWMCTSNEIRYDETYRTLTGKLNEMDAEIATHTHDGYATSDELITLTDVVNTKADAEHTHNGYADANHLHSEYAYQVALDALDVEVNGKANATHYHAEYASVGALNTLSTEVDGKANEVHTHSNYSDVGHNHDSDYADISHNHNSAYASSGHNHDADYSAIDHEHANYATVTDLGSVSSAVAGKANISHNHNDIYYTEDEIDAKLTGKANANHNHTGVYDVNGSAASALTSANAYTDSKIDALVGEGASATLDTIGEISSAIEDNQDAIDLLNAAIANKANVSDLNAHAGDSDIHMTEAEKDKLAGIAVGANNYTLPSAGSALGGVMSGGDVTISAGIVTVNDDSHNHVISNVDGLQSVLDGKAASGHTHNDTYYTETEVDSLLSTKANSSHTHTISNITNLQNSLDGKAPSSHNHNGVYANATHTHVASDVGAVATGDVATVTETKTYLGI